MKKKRSIWGTLLTLVCLLWVLAIPAAANGNQAVNQARNGVVRILTIGPNNLSVGTGFAVGMMGEAPDTFITNWHVVTGSGSFDYRDAQVFILLDDETYIDSIGMHWGDVEQCEVLYAENMYPDVAVIKSEKPLEGIDVLPLRRIENGQALVGENVWTIGYPGSADVIDGYETGKIKASVEFASMTNGTISRCLPSEQFGNTECIEHGARFNHGNSGGPLLLDDGSVIGINTYGYSEIETYETDERTGEIIDIEFEPYEYYLSIYINYAMEVLDALGISYDSVSGPLSDDTQKTEEEQPKLLWTPVIAVAVVIVILVIYLIILKCSKRPIPKKAWTLRGTAGALSGQQFQVAGVLWLGRNPEKCSLIYPSNTPGVSGVHCKIEKMESGNIQITDVGSTYGTTVNGSRLAANEPYSLAAGDRICLGSEKEELTVS